MPTSVFFFGQFLLERLRTTDLVENATHSRSFRVLEKLKRSIIAAPKHVTIAQAVLPDIFREASCTFIIDIFKRARLSRAALCARIPQPEPIEARYFLGGYRIFLPAKEALNYSWPLRCRENIQHRLQPQLVPDIPIGEESLKMAGLLQQPRYGIVSAGAEHGDDYAWQRATLGSHQVSGRGTIGNRHDVSDLCIQMDSISPLFRVTVHAARKEFSFRRR